MKELCRAITRLGLATQEKRRIVVCGKEGHKRDKCPDKKNPTNNKEEEEERRTLLLFHYDNNDVLFLWIGKIDKIIDHNVFDKQTVMDVNE